MPYPAHLLNCPFRLGGAGQLKDHVICSQVLTRTTLSTPASWSRQTIRLRSQNRNGHSQAVIPGWICYDARVVATGPEAFDGRVPSPPSAPSRDSGAGPAGRSRGRDYIPWLTSPPKM